MSPPASLARAGGLDHDHPPVGCALGRLQVQRPVDDRADRQAGDTDRDFPPVEPARLEVCLEVDQPDVGGLRVDPVAQQQPPAVPRQRSERPPRRGQRRVLLACVLPEEHDVGRRIGPGPMEEHAAGIGIVGVGQVLIDEAGTVRQPLRGLRLAGNLEGTPLAGFDVEEVQGGVLVARAIGPVGEQPTVGRRRNPLDHRQPRRVKHRRIDQRRRFAPIAVTPIDDRLILAALTFRVEVAVATHPRCRHQSDLHQRSQPLLERWSPGEGVQDGSCVAVLRVGPSSDLRGHLARVLGIGVVTFQPPVVVDDLHSVEHLADRFDCRGRRPARRTVALTARAGGDCETDTQHEQDLHPGTPSESRQVGSIDDAAAAPQMPRSDSP